MALVYMEPALHQQRPLAPQHTRHKPARMTHGRALFKIGHIPIGNIQGSLYLVRQAPQAAA